MPLEQEDQAELDAMQTQLDASLESEIGPAEDLEGAGKGPLDKDSQAAAPPQGVRPSAEATSAEGKQEPVSTGAPAIEGGPASWKKEIQPLFAGLPPEVKAEILRREKDISSWIGESGPYVKVGQTAQQFFSHYKPLCDKLGVNPWNVTADLWTRYANFAQADQQTKLNMLTQFAHENGIALQLAGASAVDPGIMEMRRQMQALGDQNTMIANQVREARVNELSQTVEQFAADPKNEYFDKVAPTISALINSGQAKTLPEAYELACRLDPEVAEIERNKEVDRRIQARDAQNAEKARTAKQGARANVKLTPGRGSANSASADWTKDLASTYDKIVGDN